MIPLISSADQLITNFLHPVIHLSTLGGTRQKLLLQLLCLICRDIFFIAKLMFQTCPEIHGDSSKLDFHIYHFFVFLQKDRHLHDQMQASVTTGFWIFYIIFFLDQYNIILTQKAVCQLIDILGKEQITRTPAISLIFSSIAVKDMGIFFLRIFRTMLS